MSEDSMLAERLRAFSWTACTTFPTESGSVFSFHYGGRDSGEDFSEFFTVLEYRMSVSEAETVEMVLRAYGHLANVCGMRDPIGRLVEELPMLGLSYEESLVCAMIGTDLITRGLAEMGAQFSFQLGQVRKRGDREFVFFLTPMHIWAIAEAAEFLEKDLLPAAVREGAHGFIADEEAVRRAAAAVLTLPLLRQVRDCFRGAFSPYLHIVDLESAVQGHV